MKNTFTEIYNTNFWKDKQSVSGQGSNYQQTEVIRTILPVIWESLGIKVMLDIPCGDMFWMRELLTNEDFFYIGGDIVSELINENINKEYPTDNVLFEVLDATKDKLPHADMILCRDMLGHFTNNNVMAALKNFRASGSTYLLATTFPGRNPNADIEHDGQWRPIDLEALRYGLGPALSIINENCTEAKGAFEDKSLGLWKIN